MTMKNVLFILALTIACIACESDSPSPAAKKLVAIKKDGNLWREYSYNNKGKLTSHKTYDNFYEFIYTFDANGRVESVEKLLNGTTLNTLMAYTYVTDTKLEKIEYYAANEELYNTATYTYTGDLLTNVDNSDKSVSGLHYRNYEYDAQNHVSKISFDAGNSWNYTYHIDKKIVTPLAFDLSNPLHQVDCPINAFTFVAYSSYTSTYEFDSKNRVTKETRNYPNRPDNDEDYPQTEIYTYEYQ
jgi:hypothetical protein